MRAIASIVLAALFAGSGISRADRIAPPPDPPAQKAPATAAELVVCLIPIGTLKQADAALVAPIERGIERVFGFTVHLLPAIELPADAWYRPRKRYRAEKILDVLRADVRLASHCHAMLGIAAVDISTTKDEHVDWGILGLAYVDGGVGIVSSYRMKKGKPKKRKVIQRAIKVANHELGHVLGLPHMAGGPTCMMNDAEGTIRTVDAEEGGMCDAERSPIEAKLGFTLPADAPLDWDWIATGK